MLVLSRKQTESIWIGDDIEITVVETRANRVRLGIKAPPHVAVHRHQVVQRMKQAFSEFSPEQVSELPAET
jgi:carbon storage regulator